ncbi:hypothetical protein Cgig2_014819 [Carnegiea gigantea]|uniref:Bromo domain-containing protein n=1 Tax=Carnegiea gigantea TaxID=171969 RepID=A0A9Q1KYA9_9CARY|nr:hypothetical protein Cgig2_014819 [Carnegiea gigantea]
MLLTCISNPNPNPDPTTDDRDLSSCKRTEKKLKLIAKLPDQDGEGHSGEDNSGSDSNPDDDRSFESNTRKRKIGSIAHGSGPNDDDDKGWPSLWVRKDTYGVFAEPVDPEETIWFLSECGCLPMLQLPDYHEVIQHPMDFSAIRKKLANGSYANLEQFEKDVFLICSNATQYNSPDTIYFRQARSIQELAKRSFENLRQDSDDNELEPEPKVPRRGRPPTKNLKRPPGRPPLERANSDFSEATPLKTGVNDSRSNIDTRKATPILQKCGSADVFTKSLYGSHYGETYIGWSAERYKKNEDMTGSASKGILMKHGKKQIVLDANRINRRNTYKQTYSLACGQEPSVLTMFDGGRKQLIGFLNVTQVGLHTEYGYARSLARFAAKLGPVAWKVAVKKIQRCLPAGVNFGAGWIGENEAPTERPIPNQFPAGSGLPSKSSSHVQEDPSSTPTHRTVETNGRKPAQNPPGEQLSETHRSSTHSQQNQMMASAGNETTQVSSSVAITGNGAGPSLNAPNASTSYGPNTTFNMSNSSAMRAVHPCHNHQSSDIESQINGVNGSYGLNFVLQIGKMTGAARPTVFNLQSSLSISRTDPQNLHPASAVNNGSGPSGEVKLSENSSAVKPSDCVHNTGPHQKVGPMPPDLNVGFQSPGSPRSGKADSVEPDLALQL